MNSHISKLKARLKEIELLSSARAVLEWDQQTNMPDGGVSRRAEQIGLLSRIVHEQFTSSEIGDLLVKAEGEVAGSDPNSDGLRLVKAVRRDYDRDVKVPAALMAELNHHAVVAEVAWREARAEKDFHRFIPSLERTVDIVRRMAGHIGFSVDPYDALLDQYEPGTSTHEVAALFEELKPALVELTKRITESTEYHEAQDLDGTFPIPAQRELTLEVVRALGFDFDRGRQDEAPHPFCTSFSRDDVRITTRFNDQRVNPALYASLHECGHALYEQGFDPEYDDTILSSGASSGIHESQSRLIENMVGRGRPFCRWILPRIKQSFPDSARTWTEDSFYRGVNRVHSSLIRVEADEVTYNLHIFLRFELERDLIRGKLEIRDLPDAWNAKVGAYLGITPPNVAVGVLQDVHWPTALFGYFPTYTLGNVYAGQIWNAIKHDLPDLDSQFETGEFAALRDWLGENVHRHGRKYLPGELIKKATGEAPTSRYYLDYLREKFTTLYGL